MTNAQLQRDWIPATDTFGARLALVRWRMGWNIKEAERECRLTQNTWAGYENGREPRRYIEVVNRIALRTQVNKLWLMDGSGSPENAPETPTMDYGYEGSVIYGNFGSTKIEASADFA